MARSTDRTRFLRDAERRFPIRIDVRVPRSGEPWPFTEMLTWCSANVPEGAWEQHGHMDKRRRDARGIPIDYARWYFVSEADAAAFDSCWLNGAAAAEIALQRDLVPVYRAYCAACGSGENDIAARLAADSVYRTLHPGASDTDDARRTVDRLIHTAIERGW